MDVLVAISNSRENRFALATTTRELRVMLKGARRRDLPALRKALTFAEFYDLRTREFALRRAIRKMEVHHG